MAALDSIRILDLTRLLPGPFATLVLADLGAQVDKVEDMGAGDYLRHTPPMVGDMGAAFHVLNRGKRSAALDLKSAAGVAAFKRLVQHYDVVFEQFRPGVLERLGVGHSLLLKENPKLVICALTGYGQDGPLRDRAGHDLNYMARAGLMGLQGPADGKPQLPAFQLADVSGGLWSVIAILAALREREQTGQGKVLDIAMLDSVIPFATVALSRLLGGEAPDPRRRATHRRHRSLRHLRHEGRGGRHLGLPRAQVPDEVLRRHRHRGGHERADLPGPHQVALKKKFSEVLASRTRKEWEAFNAEHDCCLEPVLRPDELRADPQLTARGVFFDAAVGDQTVGCYRTPVTPRDAPAGPAPSCGQHTEAILSEAGFSAEEIAELKANGRAR